MAAAAVRPPGNHPCRAARRAADRGAADRRQPQLCRPAAQPPVEQVHVQPRFAGHQRHPPGIPGPRQRPATEAGGRQPAGRRTARQCADGVRRPPAKRWPAGEPVADRAVHPQRRPDRHSAIQRHRHQQQRRAGRDPRQRQRQAAAEPGHAAGAGRSAEGRHRHHQAEQPQRDPDPHRQRQPQRTEHAGGQPQRQHQLPAHAVPFQQPAGTAAAQPERPVRRQQQ